MGAKKLLACVSLLLLASPVKGQPYYYFSPGEYTFWKDRIKETNKEAYNKLLLCETSYKYKGDHSIPCLIKNKKSKDLSNLLGIVSKDSNGYVVLVLPTPEKYCYNLEFVQFLKNYSSLKRIEPVLRRERMHILGIIKEIAPELYAILKRVDPDGVDHIKRMYQGVINAEVRVSQKDGLPIFYISPKVTTLPDGQLRFVLGHELGHYVLHHAPETMAHTVSHPVLSKEYKSIKGAKGLPFEETFKRAYGRIKEYEADRFAVVDLAPEVKTDDPTVIKIEDAIAFWKEHPSFGQNERSVFKRTHPFDRMHIDQLKELRREVELQQNRPRKPINWEQLAQDYLEFYKQQK